MSLLMQALRKAERARSQNGHDAGHEHDSEQPPFDSVPSPPPIEGGPAFAVMPDAWRLEPLDAEPPVIAAEEAAHDPVPPQARHEATRQAGTVPSAENHVPSNAGSPAPQRTASPQRPPTDRFGHGVANGPAPSAAANARADASRAQGLPRLIASPQRRLMILAGTLTTLLAAFVFIYWRAVSSPGPGAGLPMVPMPAPGASPVAQAGAQQGTPIPVTPYVTPIGADPALQAAAPGSAPGAADGGGTLPGAAGGIGNGAAISGSPATATGKAAATRPNVDVTIPTPEQLAAIPDPAIRAEAMRDAAERAARQVRAEGVTAPATTPPVAQAPTAEGPLASAPSLQARRSASSQPAPGRVRRQAHSPGNTPTLTTAIGDNGNVQFVRSTAETQVAPAVQNAYAALKSGDLATAHQQYDLALLQDPNNRDALLGAAAVALREHDGRQASSNYLRLLELDPNDPDALAGLTELRPGDLQSNEIKLRGLARQHPDSGPVQFALGNLFARQGRWPEAQQSYFRAFSAMPDNADYAFNLGVGLDRMNQPRLAQTYYRRALELAQASPPTFNIDAVRKRLHILEAPPQ